MPAPETPASEPTLVTAPELLPVLEELRKREPVFHHPEFGLSRSDIERYTDRNFWEVGASGRRYSREYVLHVLEERHQTPTEDRWRTTDFYCQEIAQDNYLLTYTLFQGERVTRRLSLWRRVRGDWKVLFHQGTLVAEEASRG